MDSLVAGETFKVDLNVEAAEPSGDDEDDDGIDWEEGWLILRKQLFHDSFLVKFVLVMCWKRRYIFRCTSYKYENVSFCVVYKWSLCWTFATWLRFKLLTSKGHLIFFLLLMCSFSNLEYYLVNAYQLHGLCCQILFQTLCSMLNLNRKGVYFFPLMTGYLVRRSKRERVFGLREYYLDFKMGKGVWFEGMLFGF